MPSLFHAILVPNHPRSIVPCHPRFMSSSFHVILVPCHPRSMPSSFHVILVPCHLRSVPCSFHAILVPCHLISSAIGSHLVIFLFVWYTELRWLMLPPWRLLLLRDHFSTLLHYALRLSGPRHVHDRALDLYGRFRAFIGRRVKSVSLITKAIFGRKVCHTAFDRDDERCKFARRTTEVGTCVYIYIYIYIYIPRRVIKLSKGRSSRNTMHCGTLNRSPTRRAFHLSDCDDVMQNPSDCRSTYSKRLHCRQPVWRRYLKRRHVSIMPSVHPPDRLATWRSVTWSHPSVSPVNSSTWSSFRRRYAASGALHNSPTDWSTIDGACTAAEWSGVEGAGL